MRNTRTKMSQESRTQASKSRQRRKKKNRHTFGKILAMIQIALSLVLFAVLLMINILPIKYLLVAFLLLLFFGAFSLVSQYTRSAHVIGKIDCLLMIVLLLFANIYLIRANATLLSVTGNKYKIDRIAVVVLNDDPAYTLEDAADYTFGVQELSDSDKVEQAIEKMNKKFKQDIDYVADDDIYSLADALYNGEVDAIIYNTAYTDSIIEEHPTFEEDVRELEAVEVKTKLEKKPKDTKKVAKEPFTVYISGIDTEGSIATTSRSDVNMLVTINPKTKQVLMTSIPRDYYVILPGVSEGNYDKLTHAGLYGVQCSMDTLSELFGVKIDYYARVNFTTLRDMVDALGGVDLDSRYEFTTVSGFYFDEGMNYGVDGNAALAFARERYNLPNGDNDRVMNQQIVLKGIINKCLSPAILIGYMGIMDSLSDSFETSMSQSQISSLVRMQLGDGASWQFMSSSVWGYNSNDYCYSSGDSLLYVMEPDYDSVNIVGDFITRMQNGEMISEEEVNEAMGR